ncbi:iron-sulfur cluster assembly scaffold protein [Mycoplasma elephantis]|uniref:iron-sulfur cluster assembly scaffold protein n=1 Tax=Mycoplasma elephantis TaxID=114882 RepID=UPI000484A8E4|nr:iron-sulfur cluster assembly scaffold protein [Mycoplasma elephantis]
MEYNKQELIMKHYSTPLYSNEMLNEDKDFTIYSEHCVDKITFGYKNINDKVIFSHKTIGCAICVASTDILIGMVNNKTVNEAIEIIDRYQKLISQEIHEDPKLRELNIFNNVKVHLNRFNCANLVTIGLLKLLRK